MRMHRTITALTLAAALSLAACGGEGGGEAEVGSRDGISPTTGDATAGPGQGTQSVGSPSAQEQATSVNDTTPHRPGSPRAP